MNNPKWNVTEQGWWHRRLTKSRNVAMSFQHNTICSLKGYSRHTFEFCAYAASDLRKCSGCVRQCQERQTETALAYWSIWNHFFFIKSNINLPYPCFMSPMYNEPVEYSEIWIHTLPLNMNFTGVYLLVFQLLRSTQLANLAIAVKSRFMNMNVPEKMGMRTAC